jgi:hypothetical protein
VDVFESVLDDWQHCSNPRCLQMAGEIAAKFSPGRAREAASSQVSVSLPVIVRADKRSPEAPRVELTDEVPEVAGPAVLPEPS